MRQKLIFLVLIVASSCYLGDDVAPDQTLWEYEQPDNEGLSSRDLLNINEFIQLNQYLEINGLLIVRNDKIVFENYFNRVEDSFGRVTREPTLTKRELATNIGNGSVSFALAAVGVAADKRLLSLEDPISQYLPEYADIFIDNPTKEDITISHLLLHRAGFSWNASLRPFSSDSDLVLMKLTNDWVRYILEKPLEASPGFRYNLNVGAGLILAKIVENASGQDFETFLTENILDPLTISTIEIEIDPQGNFNSGDGVSISLMDWTKLGYLFLNNGEWQGRRIIDPNFIADATSEQDVVSAWLSIGYLLQLFGDNFTGNFSVPHDDIYYIRGGIGQHMYVIPSENMIVSIFAENYFFGLFNPSLNLFTEITNSFQ